MSRLLYQLSYSAWVPARLARLGRADQSPDRESNPRPSPYHGDALPTELSGPATPTGAPADEPAGEPTGAAAGAPAGEQLIYQPAHQLANQPAHQLMNQLETPGYT